MQNNQGTIQSDKLGAPASKISPFRTLLFIVCLALAGIHMIYYAGWTHDDPYITFRYVDNLLSGKGLVFNEGEPLEGYSNFFFLLLLVPLRWLGLELLTGAKIIGFLFALGSLALFYDFLVLYYENDQKRNLIAVLLMALSGDLALWAVSGMETAVSVFFVTGAWVFFCHEMKIGFSKKPVFPISAFFLMGAALNRPEGVIYFFALAWLALASLIKREIAPSHFFPWLGLFVLTFAFYNLWRVTYFGTWLPNTFYAKATGSFVYQFKIGLKYIWQFLYRNPLIFLVPVFFFYSIRNYDFRKIEFLSAASIIFAQLIFILSSGGDWMPLGRFIAPVIAPLFFLFQESLFSTMTRLKPNDLQHRWRDALAFFCLGLAVLGLVQERRATKPIVYSARTQTLYTPHIAIGFWLKNNAPAGSLLAAEEAGIIPYYSGLRFLDLLGIVDAHIARQKGALHQKHDIDYVLDKRPDLFLIYTANPFDAGGELIPRMDSGYRLLSSPKFNQLYKPVRSFPHGNELIGSDYLTLFALTK